MATRESTSGLGVDNYYGPSTTTEGEVGSVNTAGSIKEFVVDVTGSNISAVQGTLKASAKPYQVVYEVTEAFNVSAGGVISIGTDGSEGTNGFDLPEANIEAVGIYSTETFNGTWAAQLAAATTIGASVTTGTVDDTTIGRVKVTVRYYDI
jgi:hypothetical protein